MTPGARFKAWIEGLSESWKDRLRGWFLRSVSEGLYKFGELLEPGTINAIQANLLKIKSNPHVPQEIKDLIDRSLTPGHPALIVIGVIMAIAMIVQTIQTIWIPANKQQSYAEERVAKTYRMDPLATITAWRRDKPTYEHLFDDLRDQGWSDERIDALKFLTQAYPSLRDVIGFYAHEVFEPDMISRYGLTDELPPYEGTLFEKLGVDPEISRNYWIDHWQHASWVQVVEMLRRGQLTEDDVRQWFRVVEIPPFWRDKLINISWEVPTRVDVRRWWDLRTIDDARLRQIYQWHGYHGADLDDYVTWTKVYVAFPDLMQRWTNGWITLDQVKAELTGYGMPADRVDELIETKIKTTEPGRTEAERDITKTDIIKGVKQGVINRDEGAELLVDMGYDEDEASYILEINIPQDNVDAVITERELTKTDILNGLKTQVITAEDARAMLQEKRYSAADADFIISIYQAAVKPSEVPRDREASKADIVLAVTKGLITPEAAYLMLQDIGFTPEASMFILQVRAETSPFSPINFSEFKDRSQKYRQAAGMEARPMSDELKAAGTLVIRLTDDIKALESAIKNEDRGLLEGGELPEEATARVTELRVKRNRAISELELARSEYNRLLAEWRH